MGEKAILITSHSFLVIIPVKLNTIKSLICTGPKNPDGFWQVSGKWPYCYIVTTCIEHFTFVKDCWPLQKIPSHTITLFVGLYKQRALWHVVVFLEWSMELMFYKCFIFGCSVCHFHLMLCIHQNCRFLVDFCSW